MAEKAQICSRRKSIGLGCKVILKRDVIIQFSKMLSNSNTFTILFKPYLLDNFQAKYTNRFSLGRTLHTAGQRSPNSLV